MKIYLVRHGETTSDVEDRYGGSYDDHLTLKGREQIEGTGQKLADKDIEIIYTSPLIRARETAKIINQYVKCDITVADGLRERHYGIITGLTKTEAKEKYPEVVERHSDITYTHPEGENYPDYYKRVIQQFDNILEQSKHDTIAVIGHGGSLKCILKELKQPIPELGDGHIVELSDIVLEEYCQKTAYTAF